MDRRDCSHCYRLWDAELNRSVVELELGNDRLIGSPVVMPMSDDRTSDSSASESGRLALASIPSEQALARASGLESELGMELALAFQYTSWPRFELRFAPGLGHVLEDVAVVEFELELEIAIYWSDLALGFPLEHC